MAVVRDDLIRGLSEKTGLTDREAADFVDTLFDEVRSQVNKGEIVKLTEFGSFRLVAAYKGGGEEARKVDFRPVKTLRARVTASTLDRERDAP